MNPHKTIFFDFDGVIANTLAIAFRIIHASKPSLTLERYQSYFNGNINDSRKKDKTTNTIDFFKEYGKRFKTLEIDEEKKAVIQKLAQETQLFIISSTNSDIIHDYLKRHGLLSCFTEILGNEVDPSKVKKFQMLMKKYKINPKDVIFITDTAGDIIEAKKAGIQTIAGILGGFQNEKDIKKENPTVIVNNFSQFYEFVHLYLDNLTIAT
jgi:phosphoglycolate phosphatase